MPLPSAAKMQSYIATARRRQQQQQTHWEQRREQGLALAHQATSILRQEFGISRVVLFGSALSPTAFHETSDLDIAVWDLSPDDYIRAVARLMELSDFSIDLVEAETAQAYLQAGIVQGLDL